MDTVRSIKEAIADIKAGKMIIVIDDKDRENEGDLIMAAKKITPQAVNFMAKEGRGLICVPLAAETANRLGLYPMAKKNTEAFRTNFTISVDYRHGTTTGISASDRSKTIKALANPKSKPIDFAQPGHTFPILAVKNGVLTRAGHTEATVELVSMAGLGSVGVLCEIAREDGEMARLSYLQKFSKKHHLKILFIQDLIAYRKKHDTSNHKGR